MKEIKFAIIGFGHIGKRHTTIANEYPNAKVVAVVDTNPESSKHELFSCYCPFYMVFSLYFF